MSRKNQTNKPSSVGEVYFKNRGEGEKVFDEPTYQNSSKPIVPLLSASNSLIIIFTVCESKFVQSPLTRAARSSFSDNCPVPFLSTALNNGKRDASAALFRPGAGVGGGRESGGERP